MLYKWPLPCPTTPYPALGVVPPGGAHQELCPPGGAHQELCPPGVAHQELCPPGGAHQNRS